MVEPDEMVAGEYVVENAGNREAPGRVDNGVLRREPPGTSDGAQAEPGGSPKMKKAVPQPFPASLFLLNANTSPGGMGGCAGRVIPSTESFSNHRKRR